MYKDFKTNYPTLYEQCTIVRYLTRDFLLTYMAYYNATIMDDPHEYRIMKTGQKK